MTEIQNELLKLLKEINEICNRHDIMYYLAGGTLIGAIRHKGFIPWDDDIDLMMTKDNWLRFVEVCKTELPPDRALECQELSRDYTNIFGRYTDTSTTVIHRGELLGGSKAGFVIDVIPLDPIPDEKALKEYYEDMLLYSDLINTKGLYSYRYGVNRDRYFDALKRMETEGREAVLSELEARMFRYDEKDCDYYVLRWGGVPFMFPKDMYGNSRRVEFEGIMCGAPDKTSDYLVRHFGDEWTTIPPHDEQDQHDAIYSLDLDYKTFQDDYLALVDVENIKNLWLERKAHYFDIMDKRLEVNKKTIVALCVLKGMELARVLEDNKELIPVLIKEERYDELSSIFADYYAVQLSRPVIGREDYAGMQRFADPVLIDLPDEMLYAALLALINTNRISKADRLLDIRKNKKGELTEDLRLIRDKITQFRSIITAYDLKDVDGAKEAAEKMYSENPEMVSLEMFLCRTYIQTEEYEKAKKILDKCIEKYPDEGFFRKYLGDYYLKVKGDRDLAIECYRKAEETTNNGIALLEISEIMEQIDGRDEH